MLDGTFIPMRNVNIALQAQKDFSHGPKIKWDSQTLANQVHHDTTRKTILQTNTNSKTA